MLAEEKRFGINNYKTYEIFGEKVDQIRKNVIKNIQKLKKDKKKIIGYGAPAKATTALNYFNISKEIEYIIEDNKLKHGKFIPGVNIPIKSKKEMKDKNNTVLVLAWNFYDEIIKNNNFEKEKCINIKSLEKVNF